MIPKPLNYSLQKKRTPMISRKLYDSNYDVVLLQEAFIPSLRNRIGLALKAKLPYQRALTRKKGVTKFIGSGLFVASRFPFEVLGSHYYKNCAIDDCLSSKGILLIELSIEENKKVQIALTHMQAGESKKRAGARGRQFIEINKFLKKWVKPGVPQILAGDLNTDGNSPEEFPWALSLLDMDSRPLDGELTYSYGFPVNCYKTTGARTKTHQWLDHVWLNPQGSTATITKKIIKPFNDLIKGEECPLSDHHGLETVVQL